MNEEQKNKFKELKKVIHEFRKKMDEIFPRDEQGNLRESPKVVTQAEVGEVLKLSRQIERLFNELRLA